MKKFNVTMLLGMGFGLGLAILLLVPGKRLAADERRAERDFDNTARQPFEGQCDGQFLSSTEAQCQIGVPAGKELVVETVTGRVAVPVGVRVRDFTLTSTGGGSFTQNFFVATFMASDVTEDVFAVTQPVRMYVDQNTSVVLTVICTGPGPGVASVTLSGHLVDVR
jgi:hypothetical protein